MNEDVTMLNLAQEQFLKKEVNGELGQMISFPKPSSLKEAIVNIQENEDGYTPLPNFICDEGYLAALDGDAIKCIVFLNRHVKGFHLNSKGMSEALVKKITGIKDGRTVQKYMGELARYQLIKIQKETGKSNVYFLTFENRLPTSHVGGLSGVAPNVPTCDVPPPPTQHVGTTTYMACGSVKEIYLKENIKNKKKDFPVDNFESNDVFDSIEYHPENSNLYSLRELANVCLIKNDFSVEAKKIHPDFTDEQIFLEIKNFAQWSTAQQKRTAQAWMNNWIYRIQKFISPKTKSPGKPKTAPKSKNMSDSQITMFSQKLCNHDDFASLYSNVGESQKQFETRISIKLRDPENIQAWATYLRDVGYAGSLGDFA